MNAPVTDLPVQTHNVDAFCSAYRQRQDALSLLKQLNQLAKAVQRHRGMSMALLAGNTVFQGDFTVLQKQFERRLAALEAFAELTGGLLSAREKENLHNAWATIRVDWQRDEVIDNFELHSHFIEQLQGMMASIGKAVERPVSMLVAEAENAPVPTEDAKAYPRLFKQIELVQFITAQIPAMIEQIARIRGLATYAAAKGVCDYHHDRKLRYVIACARTQHEKSRHQAERLETILTGGIPSLPLIKTYELKLMFLMSTVEKDILSGGSIATSSHQVFKLASEIIDVYVKVVEDGLNLLSRWQEEDLEAWLQMVV
jgi:hypothetical protein